MRTRLIIITKTKNPTLKPAMSQSERSEYDLLHVTHEYPDPDYAAYVTKYPWTEEDGYLPSALHGLPSESLEENLSSAYYDDARGFGHDGAEIVDSDIPEPTWDLDYQVSEAGVTWVSSSAKAYEISTLTSMKR